MRKMLMLTTLTVLGSVGQAMAYNGDMDSCCDREERRRGSSSMFDGGRHMNMSDDEGMKGRRDRDERHMGMSDDEGMRGHRNRDGRSGRDKGSSRMGRDWLMDQIPANVQLEIQELEAQMLREENVIDQKYESKKLELSIARDRLEITRDNLDLTMVNSPSNTLTREQADYLSKMIDIRSQNRIIRQERRDALREVSTKYEQQILKIQQDWLSSI